MDSQIYRLLSRADQEKDVEFVKQAFQILDPEIASVKEKTAKDIENFSQNLYVECAEKAINFDEISIANRCIQLYFSLPMIANQFLIRAYLCQFELLAPRSANQLEKLEKSIPFLFKAIDFSIQNKRYNFLVYNSSIIFWKYARSFLKVNFKRHLCTSLNKITQALKEIDDADYEWRAFLERTLIEAYLDNKQINEANALAEKLSNFIQNNLPNNFDDFFEFLISNSLLDDDDLKNLSLTKWELNTIYRIEKLKKSQSKIIKSSKGEDSPNEETALSELHEIYKVLLPRKKTLTESDNKSEFLTSSFDQPTKKEDFIAIFKRQRLLLNLAHLCLTFEEPNLSSQILGYIKESESLTEDLSLELEFIECEQAIKELKHKQEQYTKNIVRQRTDAINKCHEALRNAFRTNNNRLIQMGCILQWNFCLPLLQPVLRSNVRKPLQYVAECLESIESMEWFLRCQIHFELAKCDEEIEQLQTAEQHLLKAIQLDDEKVYSEQLEHALKRLRLRAELYKTPDKTEDQVAMIIEQCVVGGKSEKKLKPAISDLLEMLNRKKNDESNAGGRGEINTRSLILRAADLLAPNEFTHVLESETFKANFGKLNEDQVTRLYKKMLNYENCVKKGVDHLSDRINAFVRRNKRNNPEAISIADLESTIKNDYKERLKLWFDLCRIARKQQIWDICRVSSRFCLLFDTEQYVNRFLKTSSNQTPKFNSLYDVELMRNIAETHFIFGESLVQFIRGEGIELFDKPKIPDMSEHLALVQSKPKKDEKDDPENSSENKLNMPIRDFENDKEWKEYCDWLNKLCKEAVNNFLRGIQIGVELNEAWLICQGSAYLWNYLHHIIEKKKFSQVMPILLEIYEALKKVGHDTEPELLVAVCIAISTGYMQPWLPQDQIKSLQIPIETSMLNDKQGRKINTGNVKPFTLPTEGVNDFKKALEICEYGMNVTNGENLKDIVSLRDRFPLIKGWVIAKQITQTPIKNFGLKNNTNVDRIQDKYTRCMVGVEILNRNFKMAGQASYEIKEPPIIKDLINLIDLPQSWPDKLIELELWSNLAVLAGKAGQTENLRYCYSKALESLSYFEKKKTENKNVYVKSQYLLSEASIALGEHLAVLLNSPPQPTSTSKSKQDTNVDHIQSSSASVTSNQNKDIRVALRRSALNAFSDATLYAANAENYEFVVHAARHYWNLCLPYLQQPQERATLYDNIIEILSSWNTVFKFKPADEIVTPVPENEPNKQEEKKEPEQAAKLSKAKDKKPSDGDKKKKEDSTTKIDEIDAVKSSTNDKLSNTNEDAFDDLTLRCVFYACLFQISIDKNQYEDALDQMEMALNDLPRTKHRLLIYRFKVITKSKLGLDVQMDLQKFREESEKNLAQMYRKVALSSIRHTDTISSYQRAIETLNSDESIWLKFEYILELAQFMYSHEYHLDDCIELCEWAVDLIMFKLKFDKSSRSVSAATTVGTSRMSGKSQKGKAGGGKQVSVLPTIQDDVEIKTIHKKIEKNAEEEFENLLKSANRDNLFEIGSADSIKNLNWSDVTDIKQLECLIRANTILALMCGRSSTNYANYLLKGYHSLIRLFNQALENALTSSKDIQKANVQVQEAPVDKKKGDAKKSAPAADNKGSVQKKGKSDSGPGNWPQSIEQWSQYELSEDISNAWSHELMKKTGINSTSITEPYLLFYYLDILGKMLSDQGYSQLLFPLYNFQLILVNSALKFESNPQFQNTSFNVYIRVKLINLCVELNLIQSISFHQQALGTLVLNSKQPTPEMANIIATAGALPSPNILFKLIQIDPIEVCLSREQIYLHRQRLAQLEDEESALAANSTNSFSSFKKGFSSNSFVQSKLKIKKKQLQNQTVKISDALKTSKTDSSISIDPEDLKIPGEHRKINNILNDTLYKDVWILMAEFLIQNGYFQIARDYLYESLNACTTFEDDNTYAKVQYYLGKIALYDSNFIEARNYATEAQRCAIDEIFWFKTVKLLVDSHRYDYNDKDGYEKCIKLLSKSLDLVYEERSIRKNKSSNLAYIEAMLNYELAEITYDGTLNGKLNDEDLIRRHKSTKRSSKRNSMHPSLFKRLSQVCNIYQYSIELLIKNDFKREAVRIIKSYAQLLRQFGNDCHNVEAKQDYFLQTLTILNDASNIMNGILADTNSLQSSHEIQNISLPVHREFIELKLDISQLLTDMLEVHVTQVKTLNEENFKKDNLVKTVENYISNNENLNDTEKEWRATLAKIPDLLSSSLISCHNLSIKLKNFKAATLYLIGRTYRLVSELKYQLRRVNLNDESEIVSTLLSMSMPISKWNPEILDIIKIYLQQAFIEVDPGTKSKAKPKQTESALGNPISDQNQDEPAHEGIVNIITDRGEYNNPSLTDESSLTNIIDQENIKNLLTSVNHLESQSMECLLQAQNLSFTLEDKELSRKIAYELIEIAGRFDLNLCSQFIALYQSCSVAIDAENLILKSSLNPKNSLLIGYLNQFKFYKKINTTQNSLSSPYIKQILDMTRSKFSASKYLNITSNHYNFSKDLPNNYIVLVLQHNENRNELFAAILDRLKGGQGTAAKTSKISNPNAPVLTKAAAIKVKTDSFELHHLQQQWKEWKSNLQSFNLKLEFQLNNELIKKQTSPQHSTSTDHLNDLLRHYLDSSSPKYEEMIKLLNDLESKFEFLVNSTEIYLKEISEFVQNYFTSYASDQPQTKQSINLSNKPNDKLIILADLDLLELPLESLKVFYNNQNLCSISRDFSLQFFATRFSTQKDNEPVKDDKKDKGGKAPIKQTQAQPVNVEPLPDYAVTIDHGRVRYLIDPYNEASHGLPPEFTPIGVMKRVQQTQPNSTSRWNGLTGQDHPPSIGECENLLIESSCFIFNGTERFLSYFNSNKIASLNLNECKLIICNGMAQTSQSFSRVGKADVLRNTTELECENPLETSVLLSLTGVRSILSNQWTTTLAENCDKFLNIFKEFLENRQSCGEIIRYRIAPHLKHILQDNIKKEEDKKISGVDKDKKDVKKPDKKDNKPGSPKKQIETPVQATHEDHKKEQEEEAKRQELIKILSRIRKENLNMVCYGLPDVYM